jgi:hypothetical protein
MMASWKQASQGLHHQLPWPLSRHDVALLALRRRRWSRSSRQSHLRRLPPPLLRLRLAGHLMQTEMPAFPPASGRQTGTSTRCRSRCRRCAWTTTHPRRCTCAAARRARSRLCTCHWSRCRRSQAGPSRSRRSHLPTAPPTGAGCSTYTSCTGCTRTSRRRTQVSFLMVRLRLPADRDRVPAPAAFGYHGLYRVVLAAPQLHCVGMPHLTVPRGWEGRLHSCRAATTPSTASMRRQALLPQCRQPRRLCTARRGRRLHGQTTT